MNNNLQILNLKPTITSLEVAEMLDIKHYQILEKLEGTKTIKGIIPTLTNHKIMVSDYFIKSTYKDVTGKENKCYLITKMGCEFLANKFTGEKGIVFTAKYVQVFNQMQNKMLQPKLLTPTEQLELQLQIFKEHDKRIDKLDQKFENLTDNMPLFTIECKTIQSLVRKIGTKMLGGHGSVAYKNNSIRGKVYADIQRELRRNFDVDKYEAIKRCQIDKAIQLLNNYKLPIVLEDEITLLNYQEKLKVV